MAKILLVDDDRGVQQMLLDLLQSGGHTVHTCRDGAHVIPKLEGENYDLLLLDVLLPHVNGFTIVELIREHDKLSDLPILMMSGIYRARNHRANMMKRFGIIEYLDKPLATERLLSLVDSASDGSIAKGRTKSRKDLPKRLTPKPEPAVVADPALVDQSARLERSEVEEEARRGFETNAFMIQGSVKKTPVAQVLGRLAHTKAQGALLVRRAKAKKIIYLKQGKPYHVKSNIIHECLGEILVRERMITKDQCKKSIEVMRQTGKRQGEILLDLGAITPKRLEFSLELQLESKIFDTFRWNEGEYRFSRTAELPEPVVSLEWSGPGVVVEGIRRTFDETRLRRLMVPILEVPLTFREPLDAKDLGLTSTEEKSILAMGDPIHLTQVMERGPLEPADTLRLIYTLIALEILAPAEES